MSRLEVSLTFFAWCLLWPIGAALPWSGPQETLKATAIALQPPAPTSSPEVPHDLHDLVSRGLYPVNLCGWQGPGYEGAYCGIGSSCAWFTDVSFIGCCSVGGSCDAIYTSCLDGDHAPQSLSYPGVLTCTSTSLCYQNTFPDGYHQYGCGSNSVGQAVVTSFTGINIQFSIAIVYTGGVLEAESPSTLSISTSSTPSSSPEATSTVHDTVTATPSGSPTTTSQPPGSSTTTIGSSTPTTTSSTPTGVNSTSSTSHSKSGLSTGAAVGIGIALAIAFIILIMLLVFFFVRRRKRRSASTPSELMSTPGTQEPNTNTNSPDKPAELPSAYSMAVEKDSQAITPELGSDEPSTQHSPAPTYQTDFSTGPSPATNHAARFSGASASLHPNGLPEVYEMPTEANVRPVTGFQ